MGVVEAFLPPPGFSASSSAAQAFSQVGLAQQRALLTAVLQMSRQPRLRLSLPLDHLVFQRCLCFWRCGLFSQPPVKVLKYGNCVLPSLELLHQVWTRTALDCA